jgi:CheY-like chemotaxis protein
MSSTHGLRAPVKTILVVDDEAEFVASLADGLDAYANEFRVVTAANGALALKALDAQPIDLVVTDLSMPVMDGFELLARMTESYPSTPVVVMTAYNSQRIETQLAELEVFRLCEKPIDLGALIDVIRDGLRRAAAGHIEGVPLSSFLELLHMERKSCTLVLRSGGRVGELALVEGELTHAKTDGAVGEPAALAIVGWRDATIEMRGPARGAKRNVKTPLRQLLMDAAVMQDEVAEVTRREQVQIEGAPDWLDGVTETAATDDAASDQKVLGQLEKELSGFVAASIIDLTTGATIAAKSAVKDLPVAEIGATVSALMATERQIQSALAVTTPLQDLLVTASDRLVLLSVIDAARAICLVLDASATNVALARTAIERRIGAPVRH